MKTISRGLLGVLVIFLFPAIAMADLAGVAECPQAVFDDGKMFDADLEYVDNSCAENGKTCPAQYFFDSNDNADAICRHGLWQRKDAKDTTEIIEIPAKLTLTPTRAEEACPQGIFEDGMMWSADHELISNSCVSIGSICTQQYFYGIKDRADAICTDNGWAIKKFRSSNKG